MTEGRVPVLYVLGLGRSGSTLIGTVLHNVPGFACLGELQLVWLRGLIENQPCACGEPFTDCALWREIFEHAFGGMQKTQGEALNNTLLGELRTRHLLSLKRGTRDALNSLALRHLAGAVSQLYRSARAVTGARVVVDTSKSPVYGRFLMQLPALDVHVVHLVRDPRAVANSYRREKIHPITGKQVDRIPLLHSAALWSIWNLAAAGMQRRAATPGRRYLRIRYEDFAHKPQDAHRQIVEFAGCEFAGHPFSGPNQVDLGPNHILTGNFIRYQRGPVQIVSDTKWTSEMNVAEKVLVTALTWPLMPFYGYPLRSRPI